MTNYIEKIPYILALSLSISGCELLGPKSHEKLPLEPVKKADEVEARDVIYQELSNESSAAADEEQSKVEMFPGTGEYIASQASRKKNNVSGKGEYSLNFDDADLGEVVKVILSDILSENYVLSPKVTGRVTLQTSKPLTRNELLPTLDMLLQINNAGMVYQDGLYQVKLKNDALSSSAFTTYNNYRKRASAGSQIRVVPIRNVAVEELAELIKPLLKDKTILQVNSGRNLMLLAGTSAELNRAMEMVNTFDVDVLKGRSFGMFPVKNVEASKLIAELEQIFTQKGSASAQSFFQFMEIERLNSILAITHRAKYLKDIERWVLRLDKANTASGGGATVYRVQNVDAVDLAGTLNEIFSKSGKSNRPASVAAGRKTVKVTNKNKSKPKVDTRRRPKITSIGNVGEVKIIADEVNNALIIVATAQDYAVVHSVIKQLDVMPLQVLIEATIVDVTLKDNLIYGIRWFLNSKHHAGSSGGGFNEVIADAAKSLAIGAATGGFGYAFVNNKGNLRAVLNAEAEKGNVNVISSPTLMVLNNQEASIQVGDEISLRTSQNTALNSGTGSNNDLVSTSQIQQRKTGVKLKVKPRVNASGLVIMEIEQSVETPLSSSAEGSNPDILTREISSIVAVQSGETIVLGGLIRENIDRNKSGIPFLHELPLIGPLFGSTRHITDKTELVVLITPTVVKSEYDARLVTNEFKRKLSGIYEQEREIIQE